MTATPPTSTRGDAAQQPPWPDPRAVDNVESELAMLPALTTETEVADLACDMAAVARGDAVLFQAGDCAERFADASAPVTRRKVAQLSDLAARLREGSGRRVVTVGRIAGQYAKPRTSPFEPGRTGSPVHSYRGDAVNAALPDAGPRMPDPRRLLAAYRSSQVVLDELRASWSRDPSARIFASHEILLLPYERALVRSGRHGRFSASTHFGWIGVRTHAPDGPHVALASGVHNPIGVKIGPSTSPDEAVSLCRVLNPYGLPGRLTFIARYGVAEIDRGLPPVVDAVTRRGTSAVWVCDPMHGNTRRLGGRKTRTMPSMAAEMDAFLRILRRRGLPPGGLHLELTPDPVTECLDLESGPAGFPDYRSPCDPRLDPGQSVRLVDRFATAC